MKTGAEDKKKLAILGVVGVVALGAMFYLYDALFGGGPAPVTAPTTVAAPAAAPVTASAAKEPTTATPTGNAVGHAAAKGASLLDPTLKMGPMLVTEALVYSGNGRNIFSLTSVPVAAAIPKPIAPARPVQAAPVYVAPSGPPPPPPIDLKFFGTETASNGHRRAFLLHGDDVFIASDGDIVQRRYKIVTVTANSIVVEDMANNNKQTLPLIGH